jgi:hypothetical protein
MVGWPHWHVIIWGRLVVNWILEKVFSLLHRVFLSFLKWGKIFPLFGEFLLTITIFANTPNGARASAVYYSLIETARENGLNPFEYLSWIFTQAPNLGKPGYLTTIEDFLPGSAMIPQKVYIPKPKSLENEKYAWEEDI